MDSCMTCKFQPKRCLIFEEKGSIVGCPAWKPEDSQIQTGAVVMVPRTGGYYSLGEVVEVYTDTARVKFLIGPWLHGNPVSEGFRDGKAFKTVKISELIPLGSKEV